MLHLLPEEYMKGLRKEYFLRFGNVVAHLVAVVAIVGTGLLLPSYLELQVAPEVPMMDKDASDEPEIPTADLQKFKNNFEEKLEYIYGLENMGQTNELGLIGKARPGGVTINEFTVESNPGTPVVIQMRGNATTRSSLSAFVEALKLTPEFSSVDAPLSLFTKDRNIAFAISVVGTLATTTKP